MREILARPGGNATAFVVTESSLGGKWLELLREIAPRVTRVAALFNPAMAPYAEYWLDSFKSRRRRDPRTYPRFLGTRIHYCCTGTRTE